MPEIALPLSTSIDLNSVVDEASTLRSILRQATRGDHERLDRQLAACDLETLTGYRRFLEINAAALLPLEDALVAGGVRDLLPDWDLRARADAILTDLAAIDGDVEPLDGLHLESRFALLGTLYVLEGSRLGAAYLVRSARRSADHRVRSATAYLGHGAGQGLWASFLTVLESHAGELTDSGHLVEPARRAFDLFAEAVAQR
jgi:heme oxygenase (biliverdin-IX-beta and delta-forming)